MYSKSQTIMLILTESLQKKKKKYNKNIIINVKRLTGVNGSI